MNSDAPAGRSYVSRGGWKLAAALKHFALDVRGWVCVDLGCNVGGFTDCLLQHGAARVYAVDTAYGQLAWKLRNDRRVVVMERTNAMHGPVGCRPVDLAVIDLGWTRQQYAVPAALRWRPRRIVSLIKPHYECRHRLPRGAVLTEAQAQQIFRQVLDAMSALGVRVVGTRVSPIRGGGGKAKRGNVEYLTLLEPQDR